MSACYNRVHATHGDGSMGILLLLLLLLVLEDDEGNDRALRSSSSSAQPSPTLTCPQAGKKCEGTCKPAWEALLSFSHSHHHHQREFRWHPTAQQTCSNSARSSSPGALSLSHSRRRGSFFPPHAAPSPPGSPLPSPHPRYPSNNGSRTSGSSPSPPSSPPLVPTARAPQAPNRES